MNKMGSHFKYQKRRGTLVKVDILNKVQAYS